MANAPQVNSKLASLKPKLHLPNGIPSDNCKNLECNPTPITVTDPVALDQEPRMTKRLYGLGADISGMDPIG